MTIWEILAAYRISMRNIEIVSTTYIDGGVCCLSGRTAAYRTAILRDPDFQWKFTHEFWRGKYHQHSGDDKFLTRWYFCFHQGFILINGRHSFKLVQKSSYHPLSRIIGDSSSNFYAGLETLGDQTCVHCLLNDTYGIAIPL